MYSIPGFPTARQFPELVNQYAQPAIQYIYSQGYTPVVLTPFDPISADYRPDRVRLIVCPRRGTVMQVPVVG